MREELYEEVGGRRGPHHIAVFQGSRAPSNKTPRLASSARYFLIMAFTNPHIFMEGCLSHTFQPQGSQLYLEGLYKRDVSGLHGIGNVHHWESGIFTNVQPFPNARPCVVVNGQNLWLLDFNVMEVMHRAHASNMMPRGSIVPQPMWLPQTQQDRDRIVRDAPLAMPVYFVNLNGIPGVTINDAINRNFRLHGQQDLVPIHATSVAMRIQWLGYNPWSRRSNTQNMHVTLERFVGLVGRAVAEFLQQCVPNQQTYRPEWRIGGQGGIMPHEVLIVGAVQVSQGSWQPILQASRHIMFM
ncbi:hypothetical protein FA95DRAFT_221898 [Auriscalpium vulgare]|uniref:Uncharacterized protein n=1 Tax=Auriscalpium vulgare TaxID=40419 RepID=A0ACB8RKS0_9AGAM|nr:hypothetical protein FA95DRAFT_221898 [Auriscalpium vulgare]